MPGKEEPIQLKGERSLLPAALSLSLITGKKFTLEVDGESGLKRHDLGCLAAVTELFGAQAGGAEEGSRRVSFFPGANPTERLQAICELKVSGSVVTALEVILPVLLHANRQTEIVLEGVTHSHYGTHIDFFVGTVLPVLRQMGVAVELNVERPGFSRETPGRVILRLTPTEKLIPLNLGERGEVLDVTARALVSQQPVFLAASALQVIGRRLKLLPEKVQTGVAKKGAGEGCALAIAVQSEHLSEVFAANCLSNQSLEAVAEKLSDQALYYLSAKVPAGENLARQLLLPLAVARGGSFVTLRPLNTTKDTARIIANFLQIKTTFTPGKGKAWSVFVSRKKIRK